MHKYSQSLLKGLLKIFLDYFMFDQITYTPHNRKEQLFRHIFETKRRVTSKRDFLFKDNI